MTMRSYTGLLIFENIFDYVPSTNPDLVGFANSIFSPGVNIVEADCGTTLGSLQSVNYELEGMVELATDQVFSHDRINQLLSQGIYKVAARTLDTCIAQNGVCQKCYTASNQTLPVPKVNDLVHIQPVFEFHTQVIALNSGVTNYPVDYAPTGYSYIAVYINGVLLTSSQYTVSNQTLTLVTAPTSTTYNIVIRYFVKSTSPYLVWLANTYSGSLLGLKALPSYQLPIRSLLLTSLVPTSRLALMVDYTIALKNAPPALTGYIPQITNPLEQGLYLLAINCVFDPVHS